MYMRKILFIIFFACHCLGYFSAFGVIPKDTTTIFTTSFKNEKEKYQTSKELFKLFIDSDRASALKYGISMLESARQMKDAEKIAESNHILGIINSNLSNYEIALQYLFESYKYYQKNGNDSLVSNYYYQLSLIYTNLNMPEQAVANATQAIKYFKKLKYYELESSAYIGIGHVFTQMKDHNLASEHYKIAADFGTEKSGSDVHYEAMRYLARSYFYLDSINKAIDLCRVIRGRALPANSIHRLKDDIMIADIYFDSGQKDSAVYFYKEALLISENIGNFDLMATVLTKFAHINSLEGDWEKTLEYNYKALEARLASGVKTHIASSYLNIAGNYINLKKPVLAKKYLDKGYALSKEIFHHAYIIRAQELMIKHSLLNNDYKSAFEIVININRFNDSIKELNSKRSARSIYINYLSDMARESSALSMQKKLSNAWIVIILLVFIASVILVFMIWKLRTRNMKTLLGLNQKQNDLISQTESMTSRMNELRESEAKYKALAETAAAGIGITNEKEGFIFVNQTLAQLLGYSRSELLNMNLSNITPGQVYDDFKNKTKSRILGQSEIYYSTLIRKNGRPIEVQIAASPYLDINGNYAGTVGIISDMTEIRKLQNDLLKAIESTKESERLKTAFLANMSHEFRTPLNAILGCVNLILDEQTPVNEKLEMANTVRTNSANILELWENILEISRLQAGQIAVYPKWISIQSFGELLLLQTSRLLGVNRMEKIKIRFVQSEQILQHQQFFTDENILRKILGNLLSNALKFTNEGHIIIHVDLISNSSIRWQIDDTGIGIQPEEARHIFQAFRQGEEGINRKYQGAGLGLSIAKGYTEELGGQIYFEKLNKGSRFVVEIPCDVRVVKENSDTVPTKTSNENIAKWSNKLILIAEDVDSNYQFLEALLKKTGVNLLWAKNGEEAVGMCKSRNDIDLILMDLQMPVMNGFEATAAIREFNPDITIIAQTAYAMIHDRNKALEANFTDFIAKPIRIKQLTELVDKYLK